MHVRHIAALLIALCPLPVWGQVKMPPRIEVPAGRVVEVDVEIAGDDVAFAASDAFYVTRVYTLDPKSVRIAVYAYEVPGAYKLTAFAARSENNKGILGKSTTDVVIVGRVPPQPPQPPDPPQPPQPPTPPPEPTVNPFPGVTGLHFLVVYDANNPAEALPWQSRAVADYMRTKGTDNWRIWNHKVDASGAAEKWRSAMAGAPASVVNTPWVAVGDGRTGYVGPAPRTAAEALALLKQYGGD